MNEIMTEFQHNNYIFIPIEKIMTKNVLRYDENYKKEIAQIGTQNEFTYFPDLDGKQIYKLDDNKSFSKLCDDELEKKKVFLNENIFSEKVLKSLVENNNLFVYNNSELVGVVHFSDYDKKIVYLSLYSFLYDFENKLRELLMLKEFNNNHIFSYIEEKSKKSKRKDREHWEKRLRELQKKKDQMKLYSEFHFFSLRELIIFINHKKIVKPKLKENLITEFRNKIMHARSYLSFKETTKLNGNEENGFMFYDKESYQKFVAEFLETKKAFDKVMNLIALNEIQKR